MPRYWSALIFVLASSLHVEDPENPVFRSIMADGLSRNGTTVRLPQPTLLDAQSPEQTKNALKTIAGDDRAVQELLRDSITAPFILKTRDVKAGDAIIRSVDLYFVVYASLNEIDPDKILQRPGAEPVEVGNMRFQTRRLTDQELAEKRFAPLAAVAGRTEWVTHQSGRLLDRIVVESTDRAVFTRTAESCLIAIRTDPAFDSDTKFPNRWATLSRKGTVETEGPAQPYGGSAAYLKITRLAGESGALFVETHMAFIEPNDWFQGNPILRSKFSVIAQDQIRRLRREIQKNRRNPKP